MTGSSFWPEDVRELLTAAEQIKKVVTTRDRRLVVGVFTKGDDGPVAWIEMHPADSGPTLTFARYPDWIVEDVLAFASPETDEDDGPEDVNQGETGDDRG